MAGVRSLIAYLFAAALVALPAVRVSALEQPPIVHSGAGDTVLYSFSDSGPKSPASPLISDSAGNLFGTAEYGGTDCLTYCGSVFELSPTLQHGYAYRVIHQFNLPQDGFYPEGGLVADAKGDLFGTTYYGGVASFGAAASGGYAGGSAYFITGGGTVFELTPDGGNYDYTVLYRFKGGSDGAGPTASLMLDASGNLYGTTEAGGIGPGYGTVFRLSPNGVGYSESVIYAFQGGADGSTPWFSSLLEDQTGALYGTTPWGGAGRGRECGYSGCGTVFRLNPQAGGGYSESILYTFQGEHDEGRPASSLIRDVHGVLYGTTQGINHNGTVFRLSPGRRGYQHEVLYSFRGGSDGASPFSSLVADSSGALYGTTFAGGRRSYNCSGSGPPPTECGTVFKLTPSGRGYAESLLHVFGAEDERGGADGANPQAGLFLGRDGRLFGTTEAGGAGGGVVFKL